MEIILKLQLNAKHLTFEWLTTFFHGKAKNYFCEFGVVFVFQVKVSSHVAQTHSPSIIIINSFTEATKMICIMTGTKLKKKDTYWS